MLGACTCCKLVREPTHRAGLPPLPLPPLPARPRPNGVFTRAPPAWPMPLVISKTTAQHSKPACFSGSCCRLQCLQKLAQVKVPGCCQQHSAPLIYPPHPSHPETAARAGRKRAEPPCCHPNLPRGLPAGGEQRSLAAPTDAKLPSYTIENTITVPPMAHPGAAAEGSCWQRQLASKGRCTVRKLSSPCCA